MTSKRFIFMYVMAAMLALMTRTAFSANTNAVAGRRLSSISRLLDKADDALATGHQKEATQLYGATIAAYRDFSGKFPDQWTEIVQFRAEYCRNQLMQLLAAQHPRPHSSTNAPERHPQEAQVQAAAQACRDGRFSEAQETMVVMIDNHPELADAHLVLATALIGQGKLDRAKASLEQVILLDPGNAAAHYNLSQLLLRHPSPDYEQARQYYHDAQRLGTPTDPDLETVLDL